MKKIIFFAAVAFASASLFAFDLGDLKGTWQDSNWNADWTFTGDGKIILADSTTGEEVFTFTDENVQDFKIDAGKTGLSVSFKCSETERSYSRQRHGNAMYNERVPSGEIYSEYNEFMQGFVGIH